MALIRATCPDCGIVETKSRDFVLNFCEDTGTTTYRFRCPVCHMIAIKETREDVRQTLLAAGVREVTSRLPALEQVSFEEPISVDEIIDLHQGFEQVSIEQIWAELGIG